MELPWTSCFLGPWTLLKRDLIARPPWLEPNLHCETSAGPHKRKLRKIHHVNEPDTQNLNRSTSSKTITTKSWCESMCFNSAKQNPNVHTTTGTQTPRPCARSCPLHRDPRGSDLDPTCFRVTPTEPRTPLVGVGGTRRQP